MKKLYTIFILLFYTTYCFTQPIDKYEARKIAEEFYKQQIQKELGNDRLRSIKKTEFHLAYICKDEYSEEKRTKKNSSEHKNLYYLFNADQEQGFVLVAGDSRAGSVLAYSTTANFSHTDMPDNLKFWMESYKNGIRAIVNNNIEPDLSSSAKNTDSPYALKVLPLLDKEGIKWAQKEPFNDYCPLDPRNKKKCVTGCVATAMSQIMRYYKHPKQGRGKKEYTTASLKINNEADFNTIYDWDNMLPKYQEGKYNNSQAEAVAKLLYHTGVSIEMNYASGASSASTKDVKDALVEYFDYENKLSYLKRELYNRDEWYSLIKNELNEKRPTIYVGNSNDAGHAFVCDGYDSNNLFHINWGWGGQSDGYFDLAILEPAIQGTGGGSGGYSKGQEILIGIQAKKEEHTPTSNNLLFFERLTLPDPLQHKKGAPFNITINSLKNRNNTDYNNGKLRVALESESSNYYSLKELEQFSLRKGEYLPRIKLENIVLPPELPNGNYKLRLQVKEPNSGKYTTVTSEDESFKNLEVELNDTHIEFKYKQLQPELKLIGEVEIKNGKLYKEREGEITINLINSGTATFRSKIGITLEAIKNGNKTGASTLLDSLSLEIAVGETRPLIFKAPIRLSPGDYLLEVMTAFPNDENGKLNTTIGDGKQVKVMPKPKAPKLKYSNLNYTKKTHCREKFRLSFDIKNEGGIVSDDFLLIFYNKEELSRHLIKSTKEIITIEQGKTETVKFEIDSSDFLNCKSLNGEIKYWFSIEHKGEKIRFKQTGHAHAKDLFMFHICPPNEALLSCTPASLNEIIITSEGLSFDLPIENYGSKYDNKAIRVDFIDKHENAKVSIEKVCTIDKESFSLKITDTEAIKRLFPGTYTINLLYKNKKDVFIPMEGKYGYLEITVREPELSITKSTDDTMPPDSLAVRLTENLKYAATIKNMGGAINEDIFLDIIPSELPIAKGQKTISLAANLNLAREATATIAFETLLEEKKHIPGAYTLLLKHKKKSSSSGRIRSNEQEFNSIGDPIKLTILYADGREKAYTDEAGKPSLHILQYADKLVIEHPKNSNTLYVYDIIGRLISTHTLSTEQTEFIYESSMLNNGIYLMVAEGKYGKAVEKFIVK